MYEKTFVQKALQLTWLQEQSPEKTLMNKEYSRDSVTSLLIYDIFGGEILKTWYNNDWHFYNRINGERIDFTAKVPGAANEQEAFEDLPSSPDETFNYVPCDDYTSLYLRFINAYEAAIGLGK